MQRLRIRFSAVLVAVFLTTILVAVLVAIASMHLQQETPEEAARVWFNALMRSDGKLLLDHTCSERAEEARKAGAAAAIARWIGTQLLDSLNQQFGIGVGAEIGLTEVRPLILDDEYATLSVSLGITATLLGSPLLSTPVEQIWIMKQENGRWKWCGAIEQVQ